MVRREAAVSLIQVGALACLLAGPGALALAWQAGFQPGWVAALASFAPGILASWAGGLRVTQRAGLQPGLRAQGDRARRAARAAFGAIVRFERRLMALLRGLGLALISPARDLHTGDAQEFLLFLAGVAVLSLVLPLLR